MAQNRKALEEKAFEIIKAGMQYISASDKEIWKEIKTCSTEELERYIEDCE